MAFRELKIAIDRISQMQQSLSIEILNAPVEDWGEYKRNVGVFQGMEKSKEVLKDILEKKGELDE